RLLDPRGRPSDGLLPVSALAPQSEPLEVEASDHRQSESRAPVGPPTIAPVLDRDEEVYRAIVVGTRDYLVKNGFSDVVIGLSGGIDSTLVAAIAVDAVGAEHVHGVSMPSRYSSDHSRSDAQLLADN